MFDDDMCQQSETLLAALRERKLMIATAESCTGGLIAGLLTEIAGSSDVVERGFVTYSNDAKHTMIGVPMDLINQYGAVSEEVSRAMAQGAIENSRAQIAVAVTGVAGPGGGTATKPVGLVHVAVTHKNHATHHEELRLGDIGRSEVRRQTIVRALALAQRVLS